ncbi:MAG: sulfotransferase family protein [Lentimonas sp.]
MEVKVFILLGAARSGTTFLGRSALSKANGVCYLGEPNHIWMHGHAYRRHDVLGSEDADEAIVSYIRRRFLEKMEVAGANVIIEKTPSNCLRLPFINKVFPEAKYIHLVRDGRGVVASAAKEWLGAGKDAHDSKELRQGSSLSRVGKGLCAYMRFRDRISSVRDLLELPSYLPRFGRFVMRNMTSGRDYSWGPRFPGMRSFRSEHSLYETCAEQWRIQVSSVQDNLHLIDQDRLYELSFEELMTSPRTQIGQLLEWMDVSIEVGKLEAVLSSVQRRTSAGNKDPLSNLNDQERKAVEARLQPVLSALGY